MSKKYFIKQKKISWNHILLGIGCLLTAYGSGYAFSFMAERINELDFVMTFIMVIFVDLALLSVVLSILTFYEAFTHEEKTYLEED